MSVLWNWNYKCLLATMWTPATKSGPSAKVTNALNYWAISPSTRYSLCMFPLEIIRFGCNEKSLKACKHLPIVISNLIIKVLGRTVSGCAQL